MDKPGVGISMTRMHSSRMRTARFSGRVEQGASTQGLYLPNRVSARERCLSRGMSALGDVCCGREVSA